MEAVGGCNIEPSYQIAAELILLTSSLADEEIPCGLGGHRCHLPDVESIGSQGVERRRSEHRGKNTHPAVVMQCARPFVQTPDSKLAEKDGTVEEFVIRLMGIRQATRICTFEKQRTFPPRASVRRYGD